ncbi:hypothetical protein GCM10025778_18730 [Paeniglutamicibacter antarcticus]|uniref:Uncharacterized protein n=1 Tax=Paeniglutamicibacter antarcticus TaxID=494023 RepID=A0ABP9TME5_9MICC
MLTAVAANTTLMASKAIAIMPMIRTIDCPASFPFTGAIAISGVDTAGISPESDEDVYWLPGPMIWASLLPIPIDPLGCR